MEEEEEAGGGGRGNSNRTTTNASVFFSYIAVRIRNDHFTSKFREFAGSQEFKCDVDIIYEITINFMEMVNLIVQIVNLKIFTI